MVFFSKISQKTSSTESLPLTYTANGFLFNSFLPIIPLALRSSAKWEIYHQYCQPISTQSEGTLFWVPKSKNETWQSHYSLTYTFRGLTHDIFCSGSMSHLPILRQISVESNLLLCQICFQHVDVKLTSPSMYSLNAMAYKCF